MQTPANDPKPQTNTISCQTALPKVTYCIPVLMAGALLVAYGASSPILSSALVDLMCALYAFWILCVWQMHRVLEQQSHGSYPLKPHTIIFFGMLSGPPAPALAAYFCEQMLKVLSWLTDLIADVLPNSLPIVNSATTLMENYGTLLAIAIAAGAAVSCQSKWLLCLRQFFQSRNQSLGRHRTLLLASVIGIAMVAPGCLSMLASSGFAWQLTGTPQWHERLLYISFACCLVAFMPLLWLNYLLSRLLRPVKDL